MTYLNSNALLELLVQVRLLSPAQQRFILENRDKQAQQLIRQFGGRRRDDTVKLPLGFPNLVNIILSLPPSRMKSRRKGIKRQKIQVR